MDYTATRRIQKLVTALTDPKATTLEPEKLAELKALLKANDELVAYTTPQLLDRLAANHAQASFGGSHPATTCWQQQPPADMRLQCHACRQRGRTLRPVSIATHVRTWHAHAHAALSGWQGGQEPHHCLHGLSISSTANV